MVASVSNACFNEHVPDNRKHLPRVRTEVTKMPAATIDQINEVQNKVLDSVQSFQEPVINTVKQIIEAVEKYVPEVKIDALTEQLPSAQDIVDNNYKLAGRVLDDSQKFVTELLGAVAPVTDKVVKPAQAPKAAKKAA